MGRDALIPDVVERKWVVKYIEDLLAKAHSSEFRYDEASVLFKGLEEWKIVLDKLGKE